MKSQSQIQSSLWIYLCWSRNYDPKPMSRKLRGCSSWIRFLHSSIDPDHLNRRCKTISSLMLLLFFCCCFWSQLIILISALSFYFTYVFLFPLFSNINPDFLENLCLSDCVRNLFINLLKWNRFTESIYSSSFGAYYK